MAGAISSGSLAQTHVDKGQVELQPAGISASAWTVVRIIPGATASTRIPLVPQIPS